MNKVLLEKSQCRILYLKKYYFVEVKSKRDLVCLNIIKILYNYKFVPLSYFSNTKINLFKKKNFKSKYQTNAGRSGKSFQNLTVFVWDGMISERNKTFKQLLCTSKSEDTFEKVHKTNSVKTKPLLIESGKSDRIPAKQKFSPRTFWISIKRILHDVTSKRAFRNSNIAQMKEK